MEDSSSFTSLLALVDNHLSKVSIQDSQSENSCSGDRNGILPLTGFQNETLSETRLSFPLGEGTHRFQLPSFHTNPSSIKDVLAEQVANMLKAKELKRQKDEELLKNEIEKMKLKDEEDNYVIDLTKAIQNSHQPVYLPQPEKETLSTSSSFESLFEPDFINGERKEDETKSPIPVLPCKTDMSYILKDKSIGRRKCSAFGRVLSARVARVAVPYYIENVESDIVRFDFKTKSPCDLIKEKLRKPVSYNNYC